MARFACQRIQLLDTQRAETQWTEQSSLQRCCSSRRPVASLMCRAVYDSPSYRSRHSVLFGSPCSEIMAPYVAARASKCSTRRALRTRVYIRLYKTAHSNSTTQAHRHARPLPRWSPYGDIASQPPPGAARREEALAPRTVHHPRIPMRTAPRTTSLPRHTLPNAHARHDPSYLHGTAHVLVAADLLVMVAVGLLPFTLLRHYQR